MAVLKRIAFFLLLTTSLSAGKSLPGSAFRRPKPGEFSQHLSSDSPDPRATKPSYSFRLSFANRESLDAFCSALRSAHAIRALRLIAAGCYLYIFFKTPPHCRIYALALGVVVFLSELRNALRLYRRMFC